jgi:tetratricopeptide (TPR) repeat protein
VTEPRLGDAAYRALSDVVSPTRELSLERARSDLRRMRIELHLGNDDRVRSDLDVLTARLTAASGERPGVTAPELHLVRGSALATLGRIQERTGTDDPHEAYAQALAAFRRAESLGVSPQGTEALELALAMIAAGEVDAAISVASEASGTAREASELHLDLGSALLASGQPAAALAMTTRAAEIDPQPHVVASLAAGYAAAGARREAAACHVGAGNGWLSRSALEDAVKAFQAALELDGGNKEAAIGRAEAMRLLGKPHDAMSSLELVSEADSQYPRALATRARALYDLRRPEEAIAAARRAESSGAESRELAALIPFALLELGRPSEALPEAERAIAAAPEDVRPYLARAEALRLLGMPAAALSALDGVPESESDNIDVLAERAVLLMALGDDVRAAALLERHQLEPERANLHALYGECLLRLERHDDAVAALHRALALEPTDPDALGTMGVALRALGDADGAAEKLSQAAALAPERAWIHEELGRLYGAMGRYEEALAALNRAAELGGSPQLDAVRGAACAALGEYEQAAVAYERAIAGDERSDTLAKLGECRRQLGRFDAAREALDRSLELDPDSAYARGTLGEVLIALGAVDEGVRALRRALELGPAQAWMTRSLVDALQAAERFGEAFDVLVGTPPVDLDSDDLLEAAQELFARTPPERQRELAARVELHPEWPVGQLLLASIQFELARWDSAAKLAAAALDENPDWWPALWLQAQALDQARADEQLAPVMARILSLKPDDPDMCNIEAGRLARNGMVDEAERLLRSLADGAGAPEPHERYADFLYTLGRYDEALAELDAAAGLAAASSYALGTRGQVLRELGRRDEALEALRAAHSLASDTPWIAHQLVETLGEAHDHQEALRVAEAAVEAGPSPWMVVALVGVLADLGDFEAVRDRVTAAIEAGRSHSSLLYMRALACILLGEAQVALEDLTALGTAEELSLDARRLMAEARLRLGDDSAAQAIFEAVRDDATRSERTASSLALSGWCHYRLGDYEGAASIFADVLAVDGLRVSSQFDLALVTLCGGMNDAVIGEYERGIDLATTNEGLHARSLIRVALIDLRDARSRLESVAAAPVTEAVERALSLALGDVDARYAEARSAVASA